MHKFRGKYLQTPISSEDAARTPTVVIVRDGLAHFPMHKPLTHAFLLDAKEFRSLDDWSLSLHKFPSKPHITKREAEDDRFVQLLRGRGFDQCADSSDDESFGLPRDWTGVDQHVVLEKPYLTLPEQLVSRRKKFCSFEHAGRQAVLDLKPGASSRYLISALPKASFRHEELTATNLRKRLYLRWGTEKESLHTERGLDGLEVRRVYTRSAAWTGWR